MNTKKYIELTLIDLLKKKPIDKIKVNEIIREAGTCKGTFYKYYRDKYELLLNCFENHFYDDAFSPEESWEVFMYKCLESFEQRSHVILNAFCSTDVNSVRYFHEKKIMQYIANDVREAGGVMNDISNFSIHMCAVGYTDITLSWLRSGMKESKEELIANMRLAMPQSIYPKVYASA